MNTLFSCQSECNAFANYESFAILQQYKMGFLRLNIEDGSMTILRCESVDALEDLCQVDRGHYDCIRGLKVGKKNRFCDSIFTRLW